MVVLLGRHSVIILISRAQKLTVKLLGRDIDLKYLAVLSLGYAGLYQLGYLSYVPSESS